MKSPLVKILLAVVVLAVGGFVIYVLWPANSDTNEQPREEPKTFRDVTREDQARLNADPVDEAGQVAMEFEKLEIEEEANAEQLLIMAIEFRKMGRLPGVSYREMIDTCRLIIERYPKSEYAYKAKRVLAEVPRDQWDRYGITEQEVSLEP